MTLAQISFIFVLENISTYLQYQAYMTLDNDQNIQHMLQSYSY